MKFFNEKNVTISDNIQDLSASHTTNLSVNATALEITTKTDTYSISLLPISLWQLASVIYFSKSTFRVRVGFCNSLLSRCRKKSFRTLQLIQKPAAHVLTKTKKSDHISPALTSLHRLPIKFWVEFKILLLTYKALPGLAPSHITDLIEPH